MVGDAGVHGRWSGLRGLFPDVSILVAGGTFTPQQAMAGGCRGGFGCGGGRWQDSGRAVLGLPPALAPKDVAGPRSGAGLALKHINDSIDLGAGRW